MEFLYEKLIKEFGKRYLEQIKIPNFISDNIKYPLRPYQEEAFKHFMLCYNEDFDDKPNTPLHLLFNMATGSGKTLVMAGLILYLYKKGYKNFLFFVNSNNIILKTEENFLNPLATKYLFNSKITIDGKEISINKIENFDESDEENINIKFTTIQQLHIDLNNTKENSITYEDLKDKKIVLIADEAHHLSSATKNSSLFDGSWEGTVINILQQNIDNILLEFTATLDFDSKDILEKYKNKIIFKYDLAQFRLDGYSKEINIIRSYYNEEDRILQALILNLYRQELATKNGINLKPVILFKAKKTIKESEENKKNFHKLIDKLSASMIENIKDSSTIPIVQKAFTFFDKQGISTYEIAKRIKDNFKEINCISANNDEQTQKNQILLNTLEDENNPIRAVFAVHKLNEGWDVLNLFDIVRLYDSRDVKNNKPGKTTISEAQLIGRGARYFPFIIEKGQNHFKRKFDNDISNDLRILEELYYHTKEDSRYISELKQALIQTGIYEDEDKFEIKDLKLKESFKKTDFYKNGKVVFNRRVFKDYKKIKSIFDLGVSKQNIAFTLSSGLGKVSTAFLNNENSDTQKTIQSDIPLKKIPKHIIRYALTKNPFFYFNNLKQYFPNLTSISEFITEKSYLNSLEITFKGTKERIDNISNSDYLLAINSLLQQIESEIKINSTEFEGSNWVSDDINKIFTDKTIKVYKNSQRSISQEELISKAFWYVYNANYGTSEEKKFVEMFSRIINKLEQNFEDIYLIRNERVLKIYDKAGRAFEPDFILFCKQKNSNNIYQIFIEPKGSHLKTHDKWKENFLKEIQDKKEILKINSNRYIISGIPFYSFDNENEFKKILLKELQIDIMS